MLRHSREAGAFLRFIPLLLLLLSPAVLRAQNDNEFDSYKLKLSGYWFYADSTGNIKGHADAVPVDFNKDLGFGSYNTFSGKLDWKFTHKNHFYIVVTPFVYQQNVHAKSNCHFSGPDF